MTPAQLEEASARIEDREYYASVAPHLHAIASELLAEVKRLREVLAWIEGHECPHRFSEECDCQYELRDLAGSALAGEESTP